MLFHIKRRQQFLSETAFNTTTNFYDTTVRNGLLHELADPSNDAHGRSLVSYAFADYAFTNYLLRYTAGESLEALRHDLTKLIEAHEQLSDHRREFQKSPTFPPLRFAEIDEYERAMQLIGLCYLLHRRDLLPRMVAMLDGAYAGKDTLYEDLLAYQFAGRYEVDKWYHDKPYRDLINSFYRDTSVESIADVERYLKTWYKSMAKAPWHDSHLNISEEGCGAYFGYWAIEAGATVYLMDLDDRTLRDHIVYPKDLVDYARNLDAQISPAKPGSVGLQLRVEGGKSCPQSGYWFTPAQQDSRRHLSAPIQY